MQKKEYRRNVFYMLSLVFTLLFLNLGCQREDLNSPLASTYNIKTVSKSDAFNYLNSQLVTARNSNESYITQMGDSIIYDPLINSDELIATLTVSTIHDKAYSRVLLLEINDSLQSVVFSMYSSNDFSSENFSGSALVIDLQGNVMGGFKVENGLYVSQYVFPENFDLYQTASRSTGGDDYLWDDGSLDEIVITTQSSNIRIMYVYYPHLINTDTNPESTAEEPTWTSGGGSSGQSTNVCPLGYVKDDNNNCVQQCPVGQELNSQGQCVAKCDDGFVRDIQGNCVKKPCEGDPVSTPEIASSGASGKRGGTFGCTRVDSRKSCEGRAGEKKHDGLDVKVEPNSYLFSMYTGTVTNIRNSFDPGEYKKDSYGNFITITSTINGTTYSIKYNHLNNVNVEVGQTVTVGEILGLTGNTGNAAARGVVPHIHIQIYNSNFSQSLNPEDFLNTKFDENQNPIKNDCN